MQISNFCYTMLKMLELGSKLRLLQKSQKIFDVSYVICSLMNFDKKIKINANQNNLAISTIFLCLFLRCFFASKQTAITYRRQVTRKRLRSSVSVVVYYLSFLRRVYEASFPPNQVNDSKKGSNGPAGSRSGKLHSERGVGSG